MRDILITVVIFGFIPVILFRPYVGILIFACLGYLNPHRFTWGFAYSMPFAAIVGMATIIGFLFTDEKRRIPLNGLTITWFTWIFWMNITTVFALIPEYASAEWNRTMKIQFASLLALSLIQSKKKLHYLTWVITLSVGWFGIKGGVFTILTGGIYRVIGPPGTFFGGNNGLALALLMILPLFWYLRTTLTAKWMKTASVAAMLLCGISILGSYSRGAFLGIVAVAFFLVAQSRHKWRLLPLLIISGIIFLSIMPEKWFDRIETIQTYQEDGSAMGRINAWLFAYNLAKDRPLVGGGYGAFDSRLFQRYAPTPDDFHDSHSIYFEALGEHGFVGLFLFLCLVAMTLKYAGKIRKLTKELPELHWAYDLASMVQVSLVGYAVGGAFLGLAYFDLYYHLIVIIVITHLLVEKELGKANADTRHLEESKHSASAGEARADAE